MLVFSTIWLAKGKKKKLTQRTDLLRSPAEMSQTCYLHKCSGLISQRVVVVDPTYAAAMKMDFSLFCFRSSATLPVVKNMYRKYSWDIKETMYLHIQELDGKLLKLKSFT